MFNKDDFDKDFKKTERMIYVGWAVSALIGLGTLGFIIWAIIKLMQFFGVI